MDLWIFHEPVEEKGLSASSQEISMFTLGFTIVHVLWILIILCDYLKSVVVMVLVINKNNCTEIYIFFHFLDLNVHKLNVFKKTAN